VRTSQSDLGKQKKHKIGDAGRTHWFYKKNHLHARPDRKSRAAYPSPATGQLPVCIAV
jgi:hypothetical protein